MRFGPQHWWPGDTPFEVVVGAILTQNTAWSNVEKAIANLKRDRLLSLKAIAHAPRSRIERAIRPSGYFRQKAKRLQAFVRYLVREYGAGWRRALSRKPLAVVRDELLGLNGIGPETADSMLLYALGRPVFVMDAYTWRILSRVGLGPRRDTYEDWRLWCEERLPRSVRGFNELHALLVRLAKVYCTARHPLCANCPLQSICQYGERGQRWAGAESRPYAAAPTRDAVT